MIGGEINSKVSGNWEQRKVNLKNVYVVEKKRGEHKKSKKSWANLVRYIIFVVTLEEYSSKY